ncbi:MAG: YidE/YbjL duplication [Treponema sp.]|jgi:putative transport protein|nr:YidE/YbjL duplication [Treponema sp.]
MNALIQYLSGTTASVLSIIFIVFTIAALGYMVGGIKIKGIGLGTAGVLLVGLLYGILISYFPDITIGPRTIHLNGAAMLADYKLISGMGTALFVTAIGLIAGPKFFRIMNKSSLSYLLTGIIVIGIGSLLVLLFIKLDHKLSPEMAVGLMTGALTSTPGLSSAKEVAQDQGALVAGYGIAYIFGILGVVLFVQIIPKILKVNITEEREHFVAANTVAIPELKRKAKKLDPYGFCAFFITVSLGCILGAFRIPGINFSLGKSGGTLIIGLIIGHFGRVGPINCRIQKDSLNFLRELGLVLFLIGCGVPGGINFISNVHLSYFLYGAAITLIPMITGFLIAKYVFKLSIFNNLGSITGGMTSTPALGTLIETAGTDEVASAYAATYPIALVAVVIATKIILMIE